MTTAELSAWLSSPVKQEEVTEGLESPSMAPSLLISGFLSISLSLSLSRSHSLSYNCTQTQGDSLTRELIL